MISEKKGHPKEIQEARTVILRFAVSKAQTSSQQAGTASVFAPVGFESPNTIIFPGTASEVP